jgi:peptide/nickel transport system permease protein
LTAYILKRLLWAIPTFFGAVTILFLILRVLPGDVAATMLGGSSTSVIDPEKLQALRLQLGLDVPLWDQYLSFLGGLVRLDLGRSAWSGFPIWEEVGVRLPYTLTMVVMALIISMVLAVPIGILSALHRDSWIDYVLRSGAIAGIAAPHFWIAMLLLLALITWFSWAPPIGYAPVYAKPVEALQQLLLPSFIMAIRMTAITARMLRSSMLEVLGEDYVRTAYAKGLRDRTVIYTHALRNAILPVVTILGGELVMLVGGSVVMEMVFNIPGMGRLLVDAINNRDFPVVQGVTSIIVGYVLVVNILVDILYARIDPRIRFR